MKNDNRRISGRLKKAFPVVLCICMILANAGAAAAATGDIQEGDGTPIQITETMDNAASGASPASEVSGETEADGSGSLTEDTEPSAFEADSDDEEEAIGESDIEEAVFTDEEEDVDTEVPEEETEQVSDAGDTDAEAGDPSVMDEVCLPAETADETEDILIDEASEITDEAAEIVEDETAATVEETADIMDMFTEDGPALLGAAAEADTSWQNSFTYDLFGDEIRIKSYKGSSGSVEIPGYATIEGQQYRTVMQGGAFNTNRRVTKIVFGEGVQFAPDCSRMFRGCINLAELDVQMVDTSQVTNMNVMFAGCQSLTSLDVSSFDTSKVTNMSSMFSGCKALTGLDLSNFDTGNVTDISFMFNGCSALTSLNVSGFDTGNVTDMDMVFSDCSSLTSLDISSFDTRSVTGMSMMFSGCASLTGLDISTLDTSKATMMDGMFQNCSSLTNLDLSTLDTSSARMMEGMFEGCSSLTSLDVSKLDTSSCENMMRMFAFCTSLASLDLSTFDTGNLGNTMCMFWGCDSLKSIDLSSFDTSNVKYMFGMFWGCRSLTSLDLSSFNTGYAEFFEGMFWDCGAADSVDISGFDLSKARDADRMFELPVAVGETAYDLYDFFSGDSSWTLSCSDEELAVIGDHSGVTAKKYGHPMITAINKNGHTAYVDVFCMFKDVTDPAKYYFNPVNWAADNAITVGYTSGANAGKFGVGLNCTRKDLMIFLWRFAGSKTGYGDARTMFNDMSASGPSTAANKAIAWAYSTGIAKGYSDGGFHPNSPIVRKDVMIMLYRLAGKPAVSGTLKFTDCQTLKKGTDTYNAILWGSNNGITKGYSNGQYKGQFGNNLDCLREQIVTFLFRYHNL